MTAEQTPTQAIAKAEEAIVHLVLAVRLLEEARDLADWSGGRGDLIHYAHRLQEILSCDHGEAGLQPLLRLLRQRNR